MTESESAALPFGDGAKSAFAAATNVSIAQLELICKHFFWKVNFGKFNVRFVADFEQMNVRFVAIFEEINVRFVAIIIEYNVKFVAVYCGITQNVIQYTSITKFRKRTNPFRFEPNRSRFQAAVLAGLRARLEHKLKDRRRNA